MQEPVPLMVIRNVYKNARGKANKAASEKAAGSRHVCGNEAVHVALKNQKRTHLNTLTA